jgi:hypothetical protein
MADAMADRRAITHFILVPQRFDGSGGTPEAGHNLLNTPANARMPVDVSRCWWTSQA